MEVVEEPSNSEEVPAKDVFSYDGGTPVIGSTIEAHFSKYTILGDGRIRESDGDTLTLGRRFFIIGGHVVGQTDYSNGKVVFRCVHCGTYRVATAKSSPEAKKYIIGWFINNKCSVNHNT